MNTTTQFLTRDFPITACDHVPARARRNAFLQALHKTNYGRIAITTPEGQRLEYIGYEDGPRADLILHDWNVFDELIARGEVGFAEAYMQGRWDSNNLPALLTFGLKNNASLERFFHGKPWHALWMRLRHALRANTVAGSRKNIKKHYDLGNDFYGLWLDKSMTYSGALFEGDDSRSLEDAQKAKYRRILGKLDAKPGDHILEIGCGWGGFAEAAASAGMTVTAITISPEQADYARERLRRVGLDQQVSVELTDYREVCGLYNHIVSIGMFEHVGEKFWPGYFDSIKHLLRRDGKAIVQTITLDDKLFDELGNTTGFIEEYIFPGGMLPSKKRFREEAERAGLKCNEMFGFGRDYGRTTSRWLTRFEAQKEAVRAMGYDDNFIRMWEFYLASCIASFDSDRTDVMQAELVHP